VSTELEVIAIVSPPECGTAEMDGEYTSRSGWR
jgi:hypothetical protein